MVRPASVSRCLHSRPPSAIARYTIRWMTGTTARPAHRRRNRAGDAAVVAHRHSGEHKLQRSRRNGKIQAITRSTPGNRIRPNPELNEPEWHDFRKHERANGDPGKPAAVRHARRRSSGEHASTITGLSAADTTAGFLLRLHAAWTDTRASIAAAKNIVQSWLVCKRELSGRCAIQTTRGSMNKTTLHHATAALGFALLACACWVMAGVLSDRMVQQEMTATVRAERQMAASIVDNMAQIIASDLAMSRAIPATIAEMDMIQHALLAVAALCREGADDGNRAPQRLDVAPELVKVNSFLHDAQGFSGLDSVWLVNDQGLCVASSNANDETASSASTCAGAATWRARCWAASSKCTAWGGSERRAGHLHRGAGLRRRRLSGRRGHREGEHRPAAALGVARRHLRDRRERRHRHGARRPARIRSDAERAGHENDGAGAGRPLSARSLSRSAGRAHRRADPRDGASGCRPRSPTRSTPPTAARRPPSTTNAPASTRGSRRISSIRSRAGRNSCAIIAATASSCS